MLDSKLRGAFYTPRKLSDSIVKYLSDDISVNFDNILEPSVGDGVFIESIIKYKGSSLKDSEITIVDVNEHDIIIAENKIISSFVFKSHNKKVCSFLDFQENCKEQYSLIIGNPPYINRKNLNKENVEKIKKIHLGIHLKNRKVHNIWTAFVLSSIKLLDENGVLCFVLPIDLLQVSYAEEVRNILISHFDRVDIITTGSAIFTDIDQETVVFIGFRSSDKNGIYYYNITDYENKNIKRISSNGLMISKSKWTHYNLSSSEIKLLNKLTKNLPKISDYVTSKPGIVTGANNYFIYNKSNMIKYNLEEFSMPTLLKSNSIEKKIVFDISDYNNIVNKNLPSFTLKLVDYNLSDDHVNEYIALGESIGIQKGYKCSHRDPWYAVNGITSIPNAFFFRRYHKIPRLFLNEAKVQVSDTAYKIYAKDNIDMKSFIFSFYNLITLIFAELMGRKYGGGVLELTPSEFKNLPIPFTNISNQEFCVFKNCFTNNTFIDNLRIFFQHPNIFLNTITNEEKDKLEMIYLKLQACRIK